MDQEWNGLEMLNLMVQPGFCVKENTIIACNPAAETLLFTPDMELTPLLGSAAQDYAEFSQGCLYLTLNHCGMDHSACVTRLGDYDIFLLEEDRDHAELNAMALAARELRNPLSSVMTIAERLFPMTGQEENSALQEQVARLNRGLFQMLRVIGNMSDAGRYASGTPGQMETLDICGLLQDIFLKSREMISTLDLKLQTELPGQSIYCLVNREKLERAVLNILSNAVKFTPKGGTIHASLTRRNHRLYLQIRDSGEGIPEHLRGNLHSRYLRQPGIEDGRFGIGLGMVLIRSAAAIHGGTVLIDHPEGTGTRITMTLAIRQDSSGTFRSSALHIDYAGEQNHALVELSDVLPAEAYGANQVN